MRIGIRTRVRRNELMEAFTRAHEWAYRQSAETLTQELKATWGRPGWPIYTGRSKKGWRWRMIAGKIQLYNVQKYAKDVNEGFVFGRRTNWQGYPYPDRIVQREWRIKGGKIEKEAGVAAQRAWRTV